MTGTPKTLEQIEAELERIRSFAAAEESKLTDALRIAQETAAAEAQARNDAESAERHAQAGDLAVMILEQSRLIDAGFQQAASALIERRRLVREARKVAPDLWTSIGNSMDHRRVVNGALFHVGIGREFADVSSGSNEALSATDRRRLGALLNHVSPKRLKALAA